MKQADSEDDKCLEDITMIDDAVQRRVQTKMASSESKKASKDKSERALLATGKLGDAGRSRAEESGGRLVRSSEADDVSVRHAVGGGDFEEGIEEAKLLSLRADNEIQQQDD